MTQPEFSPTTPPPSSGAKLGWGMVLVGIGCLVPILLAVVIFAFMGYGLGTMARKAAEVSVGMSERRSGLPHAEAVTSWGYKYTGLPAEGSVQDFENALEDYVFRQQGDRAAKDLGTITSYYATIVFLKPGDN